MGSRLKPNPERTFNWFFEATSPGAAEKDAGLLFQFPEDFKDEESDQMVPNFCFPYDIPKAKFGNAVQQFTFVLTDLEGCHRFGFCRLTPSAHTCLCILSYLPWFEVFYKLLNSLADYLSKGQINEMRELLSALYEQPVPQAAGVISLQMVPYFVAPEPRTLPSIPENRNLTEMIVAVDVENLLQLYASMLFERRILIFASKLSILTSCLHALNAVLYPMYWQHIFIPVLPPHLLDYCCAPMPYLIGVHSTFSEWARNQGLEEIVILNIDTNTLETPFDDLSRIPSEVMSRLKVCLQRKALLPGCGVSHAFLKSQALLFGSYRKALRGHKAGEICFSDKLFLDNKFPSMKQFLHCAIHSQFFKQFIDDRLDILNKGKEPQDLFEEEIIKCKATMERSKQYKHLVHNIKKGGEALILNMKSKANLKTQREHHVHRGESASFHRVQSDCLQNRLPITPHFGKSRPRRPVHKSRDSRSCSVLEDNGATEDGAVSGPLPILDSELQKHENNGEEEVEESLLNGSEEMDLLGEIFDTLSSQSCHDRGQLYSARSLDLFGSDSYNYIIEHGTTNPSQESLSLSASGSGSLHSWSLETREDLSELGENCDWQCLDISVSAENEWTDNVQAAFEIRDQDRGQREDTEEAETVGETTNRNLGEKMEDTNELTEVSFEEEKRRDDALEKKNKYEAFSAGHVSQNEPKRDLNKAEETQVKGDRDQEKSQPEIHHLSPDPAVWLDRSDQAWTKEEQGTQHTPPPPKVQSAAARFQSAATHQSFHVKSSTRTLSGSERSWEAVKVRERSHTHPQCDPEGPVDDTHPSVKVSELKKRFEA